MIKELIDPFDFDPKEIEKKVKKAAAKRTRDKQKEYYDRWRVKKTGKPIGKRGGVRPGSGRKPKNYESQRITVKYTRLQKSILEEEGSVEAAVNRWIHGLI